MPDGPTAIPTPRRLGGVLRQRNFRLLWTGETVSSIGGSMATIGVALLAVEVLHASTFAIASLTAAAYVPWLIIGLPAGVWADRLPSRPLMIGADVAAALLYASLPVAAWLGVLTMGQVIAVALAGGVAEVVFSTAYQPWLPSILAPADLLEGNAKMQGSSSVATIAGRGAAGLAARIAGDAAALLVNSVSFLVSAACLLAISGERPQPRAARSGSLRADIAAGFGLMLRDRYVRPMSIYAVTGNLAFSGSTSLFVVFLVRVDGVSPAWTGLLLTAGGAGGLLGALVARWLARSLGTARGLAVSGLVCGAATLLIPLARPGPLLACFAVGSGMMAAGLAVANTIISSFRQHYCPPEMIGRITATGRFLAYSGIPLGALAGGALATALSVRGALWLILTLYALSGTLLLTPALLADRDLPASAPEPASSR